MFEIVGAIVLVAFALMMIGLSVVAVSIGISACVDLIERVDRWRRFKR